MKRVLVPCGKPLSTNTVTVLVAPTSLGMMVAGLTEQACWIGQLATERSTDWEVPFRSLAVT